MPRPKPNEEDLEERRVRKQEWLKFRKDYLFTQVKLAEVLGISRRSVQKIEACICTPLPGTLRKFLALKAKYNEGKAA
jgi:predicted transcriptional regulator